MEGGNHGAVIIMSVRGGGSGGLGCSLSSPTYGVDDLTDTTQELAYFSAPPAVAAARGDSRAE